MNIIVIVLDSLRVDHLGCYGGEIQTPNINAFAEEATVMENAYSENLPTLPCRTAWWTGQHLFAQRGWQPLEVDDILLSEVLTVNGFTSAFITDTYHMHRQGYNCGRGFDYTSFIRGQEYDPWIIDPSIEVDVEKNHRLKGDESDEMWKIRFEQYLKNTSTFKSKEDHFAAKVFNEAIRQLEYMAKQQTDNLFLWIDSFSPHEPWDPPEPYRSMYDPDYRGAEIIDPVPGPYEGYMTDEEVEHTKRLYGGVVSFVDSYVGKFLDAVRRVGIFDNSIIMITSDHGEPFGEHGFIRKAKPECHEELAHIPWIIRDPALKNQGKRISGFCQPPDLMPTLMERVGIDMREPIVHWGPSKSIPQPLAMTGKSLIPLLTDEKPYLHDFVVSGYFQKQWSIRTEDWALLVPLNETQPPRLYNRKEDMNETNDVWDYNQEIGQELKQRLFGFSKKLTNRVSKVSHE